MPTTPSSKSAPKKKPPSLTEAARTNEWRTNEDSPIQRADPLQMYFSKKTLIGAVTANLNAVKRNASSQELSDEDLALAKHVIKKNGAFLSWLKTTDQGEVFCTIYPTSEFQEDLMTYWRPPTQGLA